MPTQWTGEVGPQPRTNPSPLAFRATAEELELVTALRRRDESAFSRLVNAHHPSLVRVARMYVGNSEAVAEEVVQETWLGVLKGLDRFEGRCSLKTWIFQILVNRAKTRGEREGRMIPFSAMFDSESDESDSAVEPSRFLPLDDPQHPGSWA